MSTDVHPFADEECIAVGLTTTVHDQGIAVPDDSWTTGGSQTQSYVSPWYVTTIKTHTFDRYQGHLQPEFVSQVVSALHEYVPVAE